MVLEIRLDHTLYYFFDSNSLLYMIIFMGPELACKYLSRNSVIVFSHHLDTALFQKNFKYKLNNDAHTKNLEFTLLLFYTTVIPK